MHSRIFQISTEPIDKENYLNEDTLQQGDGSFYDTPINEILSFPFIPTSSPVFLESHSMNTPNNKQ